MVVWESMVKLLEQHIVACLLGQVQGRCTLVGQLQGMCSLKMICMSALELAVRWHMKQDNWSPVTDKADTMVQHNDWSTHCDLCRKIVVGRKQAHHPNH
jgi:hypothetical protein